MRLSHKAQTDESDGSGAGQQSLKAAVHAADTHRDGCVKVSSAHTSRLAAQLIPLSALRNSPQAICGWPTLLLKHRTSASEQSASFSKIVKNMKSGGVWLFEMSVL